MLVGMVDDLLLLLERDPAFAHFTLDGQTSVVDDYLAVRPEKREELRRLISSGRVLVGPWYVLPDEFLVSAEATVRNLMEGTRSARSMGGVMNIGYIPDSFGHIAMMPAILSGFGMDSAVVYRGFGGEPGQTSSEYWWESPDGTRCLMAHLFRHGYSAGYFHQDSHGRDPRPLRGDEGRTRRSCGDLASPDAQRRRPPLARSETPRHAGPDPAIVRRAFPAQHAAGLHRCGPEGARRSSGGVRRTPVRLPVCLRGARRGLLQQDVHQAGQLAMPEPAPALRRAPARHRAAAGHGIARSRSCGMHGGP